MYLLGNTSTNEFRHNYKDRLAEIEEIVHGSDQCKGLNDVQFTRLTDVIANQTLKLSRKNAKDKVVKSKLSHNNTALGLPVTYSARFISCLVPNENLNVGVVRDFVVWSLVNRHRLNTKYCLEPILRWFNCILQYEVVPVNLLQCLYELFFHSLDLESMVRAMIIYKAGPLTEYL